ncbi:hypothetical protein C0989_003552, partial [Termitomyces sp. Mn162]
MHTAVTSGLTAPSVDLLQHLIVLIPVLSALKMSLPILVCDEAVGYATNRDSAHIFNDVQTIGGWPSLLQITKVTKIVLHLGEKTVDGIETTYKMADNSVRVSSHGKKMGTTETCTLN